MKVKIGIGQINVKSGKPDVNFAKIKQYADDAKSKKLNIVAFPEMAVPGYMLSDLWEETAFAIDANTYNEKIKSMSDEVAIIWGNILTDNRPSIFNPERISYGNDGRLRKYNASFTAQNGKYAARVTKSPKFNGLDVLPINEANVKTHEPLYREFEDQRHFLPLKELAQQTGLKVEDFINPSEINIDGKSVKIGVVICEDIWIQDYIVDGKLFNSALIQAQKGAEIIFVLSTSPYGWHKEDAREKNIWKVHKQIFDAGYKVPLVYINAVGLQNNGKNEYILDGRSSVYSSPGHKVYEAPANTEGLFEIELDLEEIKNLNESWEKFDAPKHTKANDREILLESLIFGLKEFTRERNIKNYVVGLSGGVDSALVAYLCVQAVGKEHVLAVNMPTKFNSEWTKSTAKYVADKLGIDYQVVPIEDIANQVRTKIAGVSFNKNFGKYSAEAKDRIVDENIQARIRIADILSGVAAKYPNCVYTNNGNKSEILLGYFTLDGDGRGAISPIGDLYKIEITGLAAYINEKQIEKGEDIIFPWELIAPIFDPERYFDDWDGVTTLLPEGTKVLVPSAELSATQNVDQQKGDPIIFEYHDYLLKQFAEYRENPEDILKAFVEQGLSGVAKVLGILPKTLEKIFKQQFANTEAWIKDLEKIWKAYHLAVFKQIQSPPVISIAKRSLGYDFRRSQIEPHFTIRYTELKKKALGLSLF